MFRTAKKGRVMARSGRLTHARSANQKKALKSSSKWVLFCRLETRTKNEDEGSRRRMLLRSFSKWASSSKLDLLEGKLQRAYTRTLILQSQRRMLQPRFPRTLMRSDDAGGKKEKPQR